jgi:ABC-type multidrug transport system fused ATPase/permease subunit
VCLARAFYREELAGGILLMDEVTASLDAVTERQITEGIMRRVKKGASAVLIAHRLSTVQNCNMILVMKDGEIIERGTHAQLIRKGGWYANSWRLQSETT